MDYTTAKMQGKASYHGKPCEKHPDSGGHRYTSNGICVECNQERLSRLRATTNEQARSIKKAQYETSRRKRRRSEERQNQIRLCVDEGRLYRAARWQAIEYAAACGNPSAWRHHWQKACEEVNVICTVRGVYWEDVNHNDIYDSSKLRTEEDFDRVFPRKG